MAFAKLYGTPEDQILVKLDESDDGRPEVRVWFQPESLGVCNFALSWAKGKDDLAEAAFDKMDEAEARRLVDGILKRAKLA